MSIKKLKLTQTSPLLVLKEEYDVKDENLLEFAVKNKLLKQEEKNLIDRFLEEKGEQEKFTYAEKIKLIYIHLKQDIPGIDTLFDVKGKGGEDYLKLYTSFILNKYNNELVLDKVPENRYRLKDDLFFVIAYFKDENILKFILENIPKQSKFFDQILWDLSYWECLPLVNVILQEPRYRRYLSSRGSTIIYDMKVVRNDEKTMDFYLNQLNVNIDGYTQRRLVTYYCTNNKMELLKWLWNNLGESLNSYIGFSSRGLWKGIKDDPFAKICKTGNIEAVKWTWKKINVQPQDVIDYIFEAGKAPRNGLEIIKFLWPHTKGKMKLIHMNNDKFQNMPAQRRDWLKEKIEGQYTFLNLAKWWNERTTSDYYIHLRH